MTGALEGFLTSGDFAAFETPEFSAAATVVYPGLEDACGIRNIAVSAVDYSFEGVPTTTEAGIYTFLLTNNSAAGEAHELAVVKLKDGVDMPLDELLALPEDEVDPLIDSYGSGTFATPGSSSGALVDLTPGRWIYACFIPIGSVDGAEGQGEPHFMAGMSGEIVVT